MNRVGVLVLILGLLLAMGSGFVVFVVLRFAQAKPTAATTQIAIAIQNVPARSPVEAGQVGVTDWPQAVPTPIGAVDQPSAVIGKLALIPIYPGQPILSQMVVEQEQPKQTRSNAALILEKGMVAQAIPVTVVSDVAEAIQPGDRVDVVAIFKAQSSSANSVVAQRLLADVLILQVGSWSNSPKSSQTGVANATSVVTLQIKPQDALVLHYAIENAASFTFVLRAANDHEILPLDPVTLDYINQRFGFKLPR
jgi:Flp pilus assembly protein CpaB